MKNLPLLLDTPSPGWRTRSTRLLIAGSGSQERLLQARIGALDIERRVELLGHVASPRPYLCAADAFVLASNEEGFGQVLSEAMREGLPVVSTDALGGGARFVLDDSRAGLLVPREDCAALAGYSRAGRSAVRRRYAALARERLTCSRRSRSAPPPPPDRVSAGTPVALWRQLGVPLTTKPPKPARATWTRPSHAGRPGGTERETSPPPLSRKWRGSPSVPSPDHYLIWYSHCSGCYPQS